MIKILFVPICVFASYFCRGQSDSLKFSFSPVYATKDSSLDFTIDFKIQSKFSRDIEIEDSVSEQDMFCLDLSSSRIEIQWLVGNCYETRSPDCDPFYDYFDRRIPIKLIRPNEVILYHVSLSDHLYQKVNNRKDRKIIDFLGNYRLRIQLDYTIDKKRKTACSNWYYLNF